MERKRKQTNAHRHTYIPCTIYSSIPTRTKLLTFGCQPRPQTSRTKRTAAPWHQHQSEDRIHWMKNDPHDETCTFEPLFFLPLFCKKPHPIQSVTSLLHYAPVTLTYNYFLPSSFEGLTVHLVGLHFVLTIMTITEPTTAALLCRGDITLGKTARSTGVYVTQLPPHNWEQQVSVVIKTGGRRGAGGGGGKDKGGKSYGLDPKTHSCWTNAKTSMNVSNS